MPIPPTSPPENANATSFEVSLKELEKIVADLERTDLNLENQLRSFERGVSLSRECMKRLEEIERRVEVLMQQPDGRLGTAPFDANV
jgi:exodeoxyribonuclease VII small subunit